MGAYAQLEVRQVIESAKSNIMQFYEMYDKKMKANLTHPAFQGIDHENTTKVQVLTE
jgi:hypothetical protein